MPASYIGIYCILFVACFFHGLTGFGSVLLALPLISLLLEIKSTISLVALVAVSMNLVLLIHLWGHFNWQKLVPLLLGAIPGVLIGVFFLKSLDSQLIRFLLGSTLSGYAVWALLKKSAGKGIHKAWAYIFGFLSGYAGGALSILGPPVLVYVSLESWSKDETKAILQGFLLLAGLVVVLFHAALGITTKRVLLLYTGSIPLIFLGAYFGSKLYGRLNELVYRKVVIFLIGLMGIILIIKSHLP